MPLNLTRSLIVILIPGFVAIGPWLLWLIVDADFQNPELYYEKFPELIWGALFADLTPELSLKPE